MRNFGTPMLVDLVSSGSTSVSITPSTAVVPTVFTTGPMKQVVGQDNWPVVKAIMTRTRLTFDQAAAGGSVVNWDDLFRCIDSFNVFIPLFGTVMAKEAFTGPAVKHIVEFHSGRYRYCDYARAQIPSTDGDTVVDLYVALPFANENYIEPRDFMPWLGWLLNMQVTINVAPASTIASVSTGAVTKAPSSVQAWLECFVANEPVIPVMNQWNKYTQAASAGATSIVLQNVGQANGLSNVVMGCRLAAVIEGTSKGGIGATSTADNYVGFICPDLGQDLTVNIDGIFSSFRAQIGHRGPTAGSGAAGAALADGAGNPYLMSATPNGLQNDVNALYIPWRFSGTEQKLVNVPKWRLGNLTLQRNFTSTPSSGSYFVWTNEIRQLDATGIANLLNAANIPASVRQRMTYNLHTKSQGARRGQAEVMSLSVPTRGG